MKKSTFSFYKKVAKESKYCILATSSLDGKPEAAAMLHAEKSDGELYLYCFKDARKYDNLLKNPRVSIVIYEPPEYIQMDGIISKLSGAKASIARKELILKYGNKENYHADSRCRYFCFKPNWIRIRIKSDYPSKYALIKK